MRTKYIITKDNTLMLRDSFLRKDTIVANIEPVGKHEGEKYMVTGLGDSLLYGKNRLREINIPDTITWIGDNTFGLCKKITTIKLPKNLKHIINEFCKCIKLYETCIQSNKELCVSILS